MLYGNLRAEMGRRNIKIETIAKLLGVHRNSAANKLNGSSSFSIEEAMKIRDSLFPNLSYEYLFQLEERTWDQK